MSLFVDLFIDLAVERDFAAGIIRGVSGHSAKFVAIASVAFTGRVPVVQLPLFRPQKW